MRETTAEGDDRNAVPAVGSAQAEVTRLRSTLLAGRGPGASRAEFLRHTRGRTIVGDRPVTLEREAVAREAAAARHDADELLLHLVTARSHLRTDVIALRDRWEAEPPRLTAARILRPLPQFRRLRRALLALAAVLAARTVRRRTRRPGRRRTA
jgi:hypothetical protein